MTAVAWRRMETAADRVFGGAANPLRQLGTLTALALWIALGSGVWLYVWFDASPSGAWQSVAAMAEHPLHGPVRGVHRYAADAFIALMLLHGLAEWAKGHHRGFRWYSWLSGVPLLPLAVATGMVGYWLAADTRAQFVAGALGEWLGVLPGIGAAIARDFGTRAALGDRLFALLMFIHIGVALIILLALWAHFVRLVRPRLRPARAAGWSLAGVLLAAALLQPALPGSPANFAAVASPVAVDWFVFGVLPLVHATTPAVAWALVAGALLLLAALPWLGGAVQRAGVAVVNEAQCSGCGRCLDDCPYGAIRMVARSDGRPGALAAVHADACAGCGICVGACPSSTPFRSQTPLVSGIDLPQRPLQALRAGLAAGIARVRATGSAPAVTFVCACAEARGCTGDDIVIEVDCSAALPPSFVEYAQRLGAGSVTIADCGSHACAYRLGADYTRARMRGTRDPYLRPHVREPRLRVVPDDVPCERRESGVARFEILAAGAQR